MRLASRFLSPVVVGCLIALSAASASAATRGRSLYSTKKYDMTNGSRGTRLTRAANGGGSYMMNKVSGLSTALGYKGAIKGKNVKVTLVGTTGTAIKGMLEHTYRVETLKKGSDGMALASTHIVVADYDAVGPKGGQMRQAAFIRRTNPQVDLHPELKIDPTPRRRSRPQQP